MEAVQSAETIVLAWAETWQAQKCGYRRLLRGGTALRFRECQLPARLNNQCTAMRATIQ